VWPLEICPYVFRLRYRCGSASCKGKHHQSIIDWELSEAWRKWSKDYPDDFLERIGNGGCVNCAIRVVSRSSSSATRRMPRKHLWSSASIGEPAADDSPTGSQNLDDLECAVEFQRGVDDHRSMAGGGRTLDTQDGNPLVPSVINEAFECLV
jgi:hypothetical protein